MKHIFKESGLLNPMLDSIRDNLDFAMSLDHQNIVSLYGYQEDNRKIVVLEEFTPRVLEDEIQEKGKIPIQ